MLYDMNNTSENSKWPDLKNNCFGKAIKLAQKIFGI